MLQQIHCKDMNESHGREVQICKIEVKNEFVDKDKEEEAKFDKEEMILVGTILCPLKIGKKKITRISIKENAKIENKRKVKGQGEWINDDDKFLIGVEVCKHGKTKAEDSITMMSHVKTNSSMCIGAAYTSLKILLCFLVLSLFLL